MNKFKVGDVVWWDLRKYRYAGTYNSTSCILHNDDGSIYLPLKSIKPIQREYAILGDV